MNLFSHSCIEAGPEQTGSQDGSHLVAKGCADAGCNILTQPFLANSSVVLDLVLGVALDALINAVLIVVNSPPPLDICLGLVS